MPSPSPGTFSSGVEVLRNQRRHLLLDFLALFFLALDVDLPAQKLGGEADVLPLLADRERELAIVDDHFQVLVRAVHDGDAADLGRLQSLLGEGHRHLRDTR